MDSTQLNEKKEDSKKGNKEEQKRMEGAIRDNEIHIDKLNKDKKADKKKLAKLKADEPKDVVKENEQVEESALAVAAGIASIFGGAAAMTKIMDKLEAGDLGDKGKDIAKFLASAGAAANSVKEDARTDAEEEGYKDGMKDEKADLQKEDARTDAEQEGYKDGFDDAKDDVKDALSKMKVSELKAKIRETILAELTEDGGYKADDAGAQYHDSLYTEEEDVDVDVDFEDEVNVDAEGDDIEIERPAVKAKVNVGLSPEEEIIQDSLKAAMDSANALGNDKLADQIGNTITFFTREYVVGNRDD